MEKIFKLKKCSKFITRSVVKNKFPGKIVFEAWKDSSRKNVGGKKKKIIPIIVFTEYSEERS